MTRSVKPAAMAEMLRHAPQLSALEQAVRQGCLLLDGEYYDEWLATCAPEFEYSICAFSHELRNEVVWLDKARDGLAVLFKQLGMHERYKGQFRRMVGGTVLLHADAANGSFLVESSFTAHHTDLHGNSILYCAGRYQDGFRFDSDVPLMTSRRAMLDTRRLPFGSHVPI
jgi:hypothetical protein